jgi:hypothetical protein
MLLNFCKANQLFIVNSRIGDDKGIGRLTTHFLILATPSFYILSGLVLSLTELHENEIASGQWTSEKRQLKSYTVKFTNDF